MGTVAFTVVPFSVTAISSVPPKSFTRSLIPRAPSRYLRTPAKLHSEGMLGDLTEVDGLECIGP